MSDKIAKALGALADELQATHDLAIQTASPSEKDRLFAKESGLRRAFSIVNQIDREEVE